MNWQTLAKYAAAFATGFISRAIVEPFIQGQIPTRTDCLIAVGYGLLGTGLFHEVPPRAVVAGDQTDSK